MAEFLRFDDVTFAYPPEEGDYDEEGKPIPAEPVYEHFSAQFPAAESGNFTFLAGPNGCGKSTLMLLAAGRLLPSAGKIFLFGQDTAALDSEGRDRLSSFVYQNMEFDSDDNIKNLLDFVYKNGAYAGHADFFGADLLASAVERFALAPVLSHGLQSVSKGELQRVLLAFAILYGSRSVFMDEPMFAMEERQKEDALAFLKEYARKSGAQFVFSMHELDLVKKYADSVLLIYPDRAMSFGTPAEVLTDSELEKAYGIPASMLKAREDLTRKALMEAAENGD